MDVFKLAFTFGCLAHVANGAFGPKRLYSMDLPTSPVSVKVVGKDLIIVGPWYIGSVTNIHWKFRQASRMTPRIINKDIPNPRAVGRIPSNAFSGSRALTYWVATWGANDTSGAMYVMRPTTTYSVWKDISIDAGWNYERAQWVDMNRDGRIDCLTARFRGGVGQLLWFEQPAGQDKWGQQIIHEGMADGNFIGFIKGGKTYILVAGLQFSSLGLYWTMSRKNLWANSRMVRHRVVDNYGKFYDVQYVDLNRDGRNDVLTTTVNVGNSRGHVLGYEVPNDLQNKIWKRRVLAAGFQGDYSPGKATAFWPNKWKRKTDRPSIFLSGAGQEMLFILSPKPARTGWSYIRSSLRAGTGMIGLPFIGDIDGDSYPEVFVPQGNKLIVFSYDYNAAVAEPPNTPGPGAKVTPRPVVKYVPPFFRPTAATAAPLIPRNATPVVSPPRAGGLSGNDASQFGSSGLLPSGGQGQGTVAPLGNLPPLRTRGGSSSSNSGGAPRNRPPNSVPNAPRRPANPPNQGGGSSPGETASNSEPVSGAGGNTDRANTGFGLWPVMTNNGPVYVPIANEMLPNNGNSNAPQPRPNNNPQPPANPAPNNNRITSQNSGSNNEGNNEIVPLGGGSNSNNEIVPLGGGDEPVFENQNIVPLGGASSGTSNIQGNNRITSNNIVPLGGGSTPNRNPMEPVFEEDTEAPEYEDYYSESDEYYDTNRQPVVEVPANPLLSITAESYRYREEAADACSFEDKKLCSLMQLEAAKSAGPIPLIEWGWFEAEERAATIQDCIPGEVKWRGYKCHNGVVGHGPVQQVTALKGYCCSVIRGVNITDRKFSNYLQADQGCKTLGLHICSMKEMHKAWEKSSYKSDMWGWFKDNRKLIKMVYTCDQNQILWPGYECVSRRFATSEIMTPHVLESAYCCQDNASSKHEMTLLPLLFLSVLTILTNL